MLPSWCSKLIRSNPAITALDSCLLLANTSGLKLCLPGIQLAHLLGEVDLTTAHIDARRCEAVSCMLPTWCSKPTLACFLPSQEAFRLL